MQAHSAIRAVVPVPPQPADRSPLPLDTVIAEVERRRDEFDRRNVIIQRTVDGALYVERLGDILVALAKDLPR